jgi:4,5-dihydroxyphthalate decarboxylase
MADLRVSVAVGDYDHTRDLSSGLLKVEGLDLDCTVFTRPEPMFDAFVGGRQFDVTEMSLAVYCSLRSRGDDEFVALPVFPARSFRHGAIYVRSDGIDAVGDLNGARIGIPVWTQTAGIYVRGLLANDCGVDIHSVKWLQAGIDEPGRKEPVSIDLSGFSVEPRPQDSLDEMLLAGDIDAVISARPTKSVVAGDRRVRRLFPDFPVVERAYYERTKIFPIMHVVIVRRELLDQNPALTRSLYSVFEAAKARSLRRALEATVPSFPLPWTAAAAADAAAVFGDDFWPYGVKPNRPTLEAFLGFCAAQEILASPLTTEDLFPAEFLSESLV